MREDKLRVFLERQRVGAHMIVLQHESVGEPTTFATFPADPTPECERFSTRVPTSQTSSSSRCESQSSS
jgi:hypothetical protein